MNILLSVHIEDLWGRHKVDFTLQPGVNFLIGPNGSGKTTIINLVVAALTADFQPLIQIPFSTVEIKLKQASGRKKPAIRVEKDMSQEQGSVSIRYRIRVAASGKWEEYPLEDIEELMRYRYAMRRRRYLIESAPDITGLKKRLDGFYNLTWLSIHRAKSFRKQEEEDTYDSTVDSKLVALSNEFVRFFSALSQSASAEMKKFQETVFLSLLQEQSEEMLRTALRRMDFAAEQSLLVDIYNELNVDPKIFEKRLDEHFSALKKAYDHLERDNRIGPRDFAVLISNRRVHRIVQQWNAVTEKQEAIFEPRETFLGIVNGLMPTKVFSLNNKNELSVQMTQGRPLKLTELSSGEKQMLIILGETLLQQKTPSIYIADEPELSLHVEWQQSLINNIRRINPTAQILFATHSPDIVGEYSSGVQDVQEILR